MFDFDPLGDLAQRLQEAYLYLVQIFQDVIAAPKTLDKTPFVQYLYGNALGLVELLAMSVTFIVFLFALVIKKARISLIQSVVVFIVVATAAPLWFGLINEIESMGDGLSKAITDLFRTQGITNTGLPSIGAFKDVIVSIFIFSATTFWGLNLVMIFYGYVVVGVFIKFFGLITLSLLALGERTQKVFNFLVAIGLVAFVLGKVSANAIVGSSQAISNSLANSYADDLFTMGAVTIIAIVVAIIMQPVLMFLAYKSVSAVSGKVFAMVKGKVEAKTEDRSRVSVDAVNASHATNLQSRTPGGAPTPPAPVQSDKQRIQEIARQEAINKGAAVLAAKAASASNPATGSAMLAKTAYDVGAKALQSLDKKKITEGASR